MKQILIIAGILVGVFVLWHIGHIIYSVIRVKREFSIENLTKGETARIIEQTQMMLDHQKLLTPDQTRQFLSVLQEHSTWFEQYGVGDAGQYRSRIISATDSLKELMTHEILMNQLKFFFRVANIEYGRKHKLDFAEKVIENWAIENLTKEDRIKMIESVVSQRMEHLPEDSADKKVYQHVLEKLSADLTLLRTNPYLTGDSYLQLVQDALKTFDQLNLKTDNGNNYTLINLIAATYYDASQHVGADVRVMLVAWYNKHTVYTPPTFTELTDRIDKYMAMLSDAGYMSARGQEKMRNILTHDLNLFQSSSDSTMLTQTAISSLQKLERIAGDTEDREIYAQIYCDMALNKGFSIGKAVEEWMYGKFDKELEEIRDNRLPWE